MTPNTAIVWDQSIFHPHRSETGPQLLRPLIQLVLPTIDFRRSSRSQQTLPDGVAIWDADQWWARHLAQFLFCLSLGGVRGFAHPEKPERYYHKWSLGIALIFKTMLPAGTAKIRQLREEKRSIRS